MPSPSQTQRISALTALFGLACAGAAQAATGPEDAGTVLLAVGAVTFERGADAATALKRGAVLKAGDRITTRDGSHVHVRLRDGGLVAVRPNSIFEIALFEFDPAQPAAGKVRYNLKHGVVRSVTGQIGEINKEAFRLNTPVAAIGVRGTDFVTASDDSATRVAVRSGAIIVASLGEGCSAEGLGGCASGGLLMSAMPGQSGLVEVGAHDRVPRLRREQIEDLLPDRRSPALSSEPVATNGTEKRDETRNTVASAVTEPLIVLQAVQMAAAQVPPPPPPPPPAAPPPPPTGVHWGRWADNAQPAEMAHAAALMQLGKPIQIATSRFALGVDAMADAFAQSGSASFKVHSADAFVYQGNVATRASVDNGKLDIFFDTRSFGTSFTVVEQNGTRYDLAAQGTIVRNGFMISDPYQSNTKFYGVIGADLKQVGSLFEAQPKEGKELSGAIHWRR